MFCRSFIRMGTHSSGVALLGAEIVTKTRPNPMPTTTSGIDNAPSGAMLGPSSLLIVTNPFKIFIMNDLYEWDEVANQ